MKPANMQNAVMFLGVGLRNFEHTLSVYEREYKEICIRASELEALIRNTVSDMADLEVALKVLKND